MQRKLRAHASAGIGVVQLDDEPNFWPCRFSSSILKWSTWFPFDRRHLIPMLSHIVRILPLSCVLEARQRGCSIGVALIQALMSTPTSTWGSQLRAQVDLRCVLQVCAVRLVQQLRVDHDAHCDMAWTAWRKASPEPGSGPAWAEDVWPFSSARGYGAILATMATSGPVRDDSSHSAKHHTEKAFW